MDKSLLKALCVFALFTLNACGSIGSLFSSDDEPEEIVQGERISVLQLQKDLEFQESDLTNISFATPEPWPNEFWPQVGGYPNHALQHLAFNSEEPARLWSRGIGGGSDEIPLTTQPIVVADVVFVLIVQRHE